MKLFFKIELTVLACCMMTSVVALQLTSSAFQSNQPVPKIYTCKGKDISPPLSWSEIPKNTQSLVLILSDPDAPSGVWYHWIIYNIPPSVKNFEENIKRLPHGLLIGKNSWGKIRYNGPCPPFGTHRYIFTLYALNSVLPTQGNLDDASLAQAMQGHIIGSTYLITYFSN